MALDVEYGTNIKKEKKKVKYIGRDFSSIRQNLIEFAKSLCKIAVNCSSVEELLSSKYESMNVSEKLIEQTGVIGEKLEIGSFELINSEYVGFYIHAGNKIATLVGPVSYTHLTLPTNREV